MHAAHFKVRYLLQLFSESSFTGTANIAPADLKIIKGIAVKYVKDIFRRLRDHGYDENTMTLYVTGGGSCLVKNFSKFNADRVKFIDDICAAAKGYEYLAEAVKFLQSLEHSRNAFIVSVVLDAVSGKSRLIMFRLKKSGESFGRNCRRCRLLRRLLLFSL